MTTFVSPNFCKVMKSKKLKNTKYEQLYVEKDIGEFEEKSGIYYRECQRKAFLPGSMISRDFRGWDTQLFRISVKF